MLGILQQYSNPHLSGLFQPPFLVIPNAIRGIENHVDKDGAEKYSYNLAGYAPSEISVKFDAATHIVSIEADQISSDGRSQRKASAAFSVSPYATADDLSLSIMNGVLTVTVAPLEDKKEKQIVELNKEFTRAEKAEKE